jgi:pyroglutamyl-peptidase
LRLLLIGFEPFGGSAVNPSQEIVRAIEARREKIAGIELHTRILPVEAKRGPAMLLAAVDEIRPQVVLCLGESGRASAITLERVFVNLADYRIADNAGVTLSNRPIAPRGPAAYCSSLPLTALHDAVASRGIPVEYSLSAGAFLCNHVAYAILHHVRRRAVRTGFVHVPRLPEQVRGKKQAPRMPLRVVVRAVEAMIIALAQRPAATRRNAGSR